MNASINDSKVLESLVDILDASTARDIAIVLAQSKHFGYGMVLMRYADALTYPTGLPETTLQARLQKDANYTDTAEARRVS